MPLDTVHHEVMRLAAFERFLDEETAAAEILLADEAEANDVGPVGCKRECHCRKVCTGGRVDCEPRHVQGTTCMRTSDGVELCQLWWWWLQQLGWPPLTPARPGQRASPASPASTRLARRNFDSARKGFLDHGNSWGGVTVSCFHGRTERDRSIDCEMF